MNTYIYAHGPNLIDYTATDTDKGYVSGKYLNVTGTPTTPGGSTAWSVSEYIDVSGISRIRVSISLNSASNPSICYYDSSKNFISGTAYGGRESFQENLPTGTKYIRFSYSENAIARGWEVYDTTVKWRDYTPHLYTIGNNIFDPTAKDPDNGYENNKYVIANGSEGSNNSWYISEYIDISGISKLKITVSTGAAPGICFYDSDGNVVSGGQAYAGRPSFTLNVPANATKVRMSIFRSSGEGFGLYALEWRDKAAYKYTSGSWTK